MAAVAKPQTEVVQNRQFIPTHLHFLLSSVELRTADKLWRTNMCHRTKKISAKLAKRFWRYRNFYRATAMLSAVYTVVVCLFVCLYVCVCVCLSHSGIVSKRLNVGSRKQCHTIAP